MSILDNLYRELDAQEWKLCGYYIEKAQDYYESEKYSEARESLNDAINICMASSTSPPLAPIARFRRI